MEMGTKMGMEAVPEKLPEVLRDKEVKEDGAIANYQGLEVIVRVRMENMSLIRYQDREFVVESKDLS